MDMDKDRVKSLCRAIIRAGRGMDEIEMDPDSGPVRELRHQVNAAVRDATQMLASLEQRDLFTPATTKAEAAEQLKEALDRR